MADQEETKPAPPIGGWTCSTDEEQWSEFEDFATREEAIAAAPEFLELEDGQGFYTGRAVALTCAHLPDRGEAVVDGINEDLYEVIGGDHDHELKAPTKEQLAELDALIDGWIEKHDLLPNYFLIEETKAHEYEAPEPEPVESTKYDVGKQCERCRLTISHGEIVKHYTDDVIQHAKCEPR